jgi:pimeloyl-ACP methyl ester carboxylesterase
MTVSEKPPIVMVHGMYATGQVWDLWKGYFQRAGYEVHTPTLRLHDVNPEAPPPEGIATLSVGDYVNDLEKFIQSLGRKPILFGHSMGGLLTQLLAARGLAQAAVLVTPAPPAGINAIKPKPLLTFIRILSRWGFWRKPHRPTRRAADFGMFNRLEKSAADAEYSRFVHESGRALFEIAYWWLDGRHTTRLDFTNMPCDLLLLGASDDGTVAPSVVRATAKRYGARATYVELPGHSHFPLSEPGWEKVAQQCLDWLKARSPA